MTPESEIDRLFKLEHDRLFKRMAPDDHKPVPDAPVPMEDSNGTPRDTEKRSA